MLAQKNIIKNKSTAYLKWCFLLYLSTYQHIYQQYKPFLYPATDNATIFTEKQSISTERKA